MQREKLIPQVKTFCFEIKVINVIDTFVPTVAELKNYKSNLLSVDITLTTTDDTLDSKFVFIDNDTKLKDTLYVATADKRVSDGGVEIILGGWKDKENYRNWDKTDYIVNYIVNFKEDQQLLIIRNPKPGSKRTVIYYINLIKVTYGKV